MKTNLKVNIDKTEDIFDEKYDVIEKSPLKIRKIQKYDPEEEKQQSLHFIPELK